MYASMQIATDIFSPHTLRSLASALMGFIIPNFPLSLSVTELNANAAQSGNCFTQERRHFVDSQEESKSLNPSALGLF